MYIKQKLFFLFLAVMLLLTEKAFSQASDCKNAPSQCIFADLLRRQNEEDRKMTSRISDRTYCDMKWPPKDAVPELNDLPPYIFFYPRIMPDNFSGCYTLWDYKGAKISIIYFKNSEPISEEHFYADKKSVFCEVKEKEYKKSGKICLGAEAIKQNLRAAYSSVSNSLDPLVPHEFDPRR
jgi:hypothetical protein